MPSTDQPPAPMGDSLLTLYGESVGDVYGYLLRRCRDRTEAEDLTSDVFMAAAAAVHKEPPPELSVAWLIGVARHKLVDHWRHVEPGPGVPRWRGPSGRGSRQLQRLAGRRDTAR